MIKGHFERKTGVLLFYVEIFHTRSFVLSSIINCALEVGAMACSCPFISGQPQATVPTYAYTKKHL